MIGWVGGGRGMKGKGEGEEEEEKEKEGEGEGEGEEEGEGEGQKSGMQLSDCCRSKWFGDEFKHIGILCCTFNITVVFG